MGRIDTKIAKIEQRVAELERMKIELEEQRKASTLNLENQSVKALTDHLDRVAAEFKTTPKKVAALMSAYAKSNTPTRPTKPATIKYRDTAPDCQNNTWSGRGLPPLWIKRYEAVGRKREEFLVK